MVHNLVGCLAVVIHWVASRPVLVVGVAVEVISVDSVGGAFYGGVVAEWVGGDGFWIINTPFLSVI